MLTLDCTYRRGDFELRATCAIDAPLTGVFGRSGAGKTTLLHLIAGLLRPSSGRLALDGRTLFDAASGIDVPPRRRRIGVVFQDGRLLPHYTVRGNLLYGRRRRDDGLEPGAVIELLELGGLLRRRPRDLSGGEAQRVALGRALLSSPRLLLLDEPLTGLDHAIKRQVVHFLERVRDAFDVPILYVTHHMDELLRLTDRLLIVGTGNVVGPGRFLDLALDDDVAHLLPPPDGWRTGDGGLVNVLRLAEGVDGPTIAGADGGPGQRLRLGAAPGGGARAAATVTFRPEDVALALDALPATSIRNQLRGHVVRCATRGDTVLVEIDVGQPLLAAITPDAARDLDVRPGREVRCLIKSTAFRAFE